MRFTLLHISQDKAQSRAVLDTVIALQVKKDTTP
jgi:hypothetical protein